MYKRAKLNQTNTVACVRTTFSVTGFWVNNTQTIIPQETAHMNAQQVKNRKGSGAMASNFTDTVMKRS